MEKSAKQRRSSAGRRSPAQKKNARPLSARGRSGGRVRSSTSEFEQILAAAALSPRQYVLRLYVTGSTPRSSRAIQNIRALCDRHLEGRYDLAIIDIYQQPALASREQIIAAPTLIRKLPMPLRKVIGDLSDESQVLMGLDLSPHDLADQSTSTGLLGG
jgi:circadian clock protein KaiB